MVIHKRKKNTRIRGARTCGWGFRQKHKGHGNKGGVGLAGSGKKADHKKQKALEIAREKGAKKYFGRSGFTSMKTAKKKILKINLKDVKERIFHEEDQKIDLSKYKILGVGEGFKAEITALSASNSAKEKMEKSGGKIIVLRDEEE